MITATAVTTAAPLNTRAERLHYDALPDGWFSEREAIAALRALPGLSGYDDDTLHTFLGHLVDLQYVTYRIEYKTERMSDTAFQKLQAALNFRADTPRQHRFVVHHYHKNQLSDIPFEADLQKATEQVKDALKKQADEDDAKLLAAARRLGITLPTAASTNDTTKEPSNG